MSEIDETELSPDTLAAIELLRETLPEALSPEAIEDDPEPVVAETNDPPDDGYVWDGEEWVTPEQHEQRMLDEMEA